MENLVDDTTGRRNHRALTLPGIAYPATVAPSGGTTRSGGLTTP